MSSDLESNWPRCAGCGAPEPECRCEENDFDCGQCGGEGVTYDCIDGQCLDAEIGCDLCATKCDYCS